ncbi:pH-response regulator protein palA/rim20 [Allomyces arbusculus]|nr:pH-response regulator protein palA/rim20 [Allomyces arbusculus]
MSLPTGLAPTFWDHLAEMTMITSSATGSPGNRSPVEPASTFLAFPTKLNYGPAAPAKRSRPPSPVRMLLKLAGKTPPPASPSTGPTLNPFASSPTERGRPREALSLGAGPAALCSPLNFKEIILPRLVRAALVSAGKAATLTDEVTAATLTQRYPELLPTEGTWRAVDQFRVHAGVPERSDAGIAKLLEYYSFLLLLEACFPSDKSDDLAVSFTWSEAFSETDKSPKKVTTSCIQCEKAAVLFNLAAVHAQLAAKQSVRTTAGIKTAALHFQSAAGILNYIRVELVPRFSAKVEKTADMSPGTLEALTELMIAQANECYLEKASTDGTSDTVISQLAAQTAAHYETVQLVGTKSDAPKILKALNPTASRGPRLPRDWLAHACTKAQLYTAIAHSHSPHPRTEVCVGHRIARLALAKSLVERSIKEPEQLGAILVRQCEYHRNQIAAALRSLEVENKMLGEPVPDARSLAPLRRLPDPVAAPIPFSPPEAIGTSRSPSGPGFSHILLHSAHWPEWVRCVRTLDEVVNQIGPQVQRLLPKCDEIMAQLRSSSSLVHGTTRGLNHGSDLELNPDNLVRTLQSLRADESVLSLSQLVASLARASTTSRNLCARAQAMLDRVKVDHFAHDPKAYSAIAVLRPRLVALTERVQHTAEVAARLEGASQGPETRGAVWNEWTADRIREVAVKMARAKGAGYDQVDEPIALEELALYLVAVRADLAKFVARLEQIHVDLSSTESLAATREALLQQCASGQDVVERAERLIRRAITTQAQVADSVTQHQDPVEARTALSSLVRTLSTLADLRNKAENALSAALDQQEQLEALVVECECLPGVLAVGTVSSLNVHTDAILPLAPLSSGSDALNTPRNSAARPVSAASPSKQAPVLTDELLRDLDTAQARADRAAHVDEWTAEQVELAKERKRKWKQATAAVASAGPVPDASPPRATTHDSAAQDRSPSRLAATSMPSVHTSAPAPARTLRRRATCSKNRAWDRERELEHCFGQMSVGLDPVPLDKVLADSGLVASADSVTQRNQQQQTETENVVKHFAAAAAIASGRVRSRSHRRTESGRSTHKVQGLAVDVGDAPVAFGGVPVPRPPSPVQKRAMDGDERRSARRRERRLTLRDTCPAAEELQRLAQWLPPTLRHSALRFISSGDGDQLGTIYERIPPSLISLKLFNDEDGHEVLDEESAVSVARAFSTQLTNLTAFYHHFLPFPDLPLVLDALASRDTLMESLTLHFVAPEDRAKLSRGKNNRSTSLRVQRMHIFADDIIENQSQLLSIPMHVLMLELPKWSAACVDHVVQHLVMPGLRELHFEATAPGWSETHRSFPLVSVRADPLPPSPESLTLPGGMPPGSLAKAIRAGWTLPPSLKHLDLSGSKVNSPDIDFLHSRLPTGLVSLAMRGCGLWGAPGQGLPLTVRVIGVSYNWDLRQGPWIALLPPSLCKIKMENCPGINTEAAVAALAEVQQRAGMTCQGAPKLQIIGMKGINNEGAAC